MTYTGLYQPELAVGDEVLYLDVGGELYKTGVVKQIINIHGGPNRLNVLLDNGQYAYDNINKFVKVWKLKTQNKFKKGDRVIWHDKPFNARRKATVIGDPQFENEGYYTIEVDSKYSLYNTFNVHVDNLEPMNKENKMANVADKEYAVKCAKWFKSAYAAITKAGGVPEIVIDSIPADVLDNLIRNDLHLEYKK